MIKNRKQVIQMEKLTPERRQKRQQENEAKKEYLQSYRKYKQKAKRLEEQLEELRLGKMHPSLVVSDMPSAHNQKDMSDYMVQYDALMSKIIRARKDAVTRFTEVQQAIENLEDENEKTVLTLRYLRNYEWKKICVKIQYSWRQVHYIHSRALEHFKIIA